MIRLLKSFQFAWRGLRAAFSEQPNLRIHAGAASLVVVAGLFFEISVGDWALLALCVGLVVVAELFNTAIEYLVDMVQPQFEPRAGKVKDIAAAAVLMAAITSIIVAVLIFMKYVFP